jgi:hypothetical protein
MTSTAALNLDQSSFKLFYQPPNDDNFYHVTFKPFNPISQPYENYEDDYDYDLFSQDDSYHITCKLLPHTLIINILNKEFYGIDFDSNDLKVKYTLNLNQKYNLEQNLKQGLPFPLKRFVF